jgi:CheY-like chemotaxis protein
MAADHMNSEHRMPGDSSTKPMEILLVEDGWVDARVTIHAVRRSQVHHRITLLRTVAEATEFLMRQGIFSRAPWPDLLLLDMMLPDGSGIDVIEKLADLTPPESMEPPTTVVLTASSDERLAQQCSELQVSDFMKKPVSEEDFMRVVREHKRLMVHRTPVMSPA